MTWRARAVTAGTLVAWLVLALGVVEERHAEANGANQREVQGRVASVDAATGTLVVVSEFRGKTTRVTLTATPRVRVFTCGDEQASLARIQKGMTVSAFYEVVGTDGVVNLIVVEPAR